MNKFFAGFLACSTIMGAITIVCFVAETLLKVLGVA